MILRGLSVKPLRGWGARAKYFIAVWDNCRNTGYSGRIGIHEILVLNDELRDMIAAGSSAHQIRKAAEQQGMINIRTDGFRKVQEGLTTIDEVLTAVGDIQDLSRMSAQ